MSFLISGPESEPPPQARFSGKIPEQGEDDFPPKPARPDLAGGNGRFRYLCLGIGMTVSFTFPALGFWKRKFQVKTFVKNDCRIERHPFLALESLDQSGGTGREKLFEMLVRQFLVQKTAEHQQSASFTVAFRDFGLHHHVAGLALGAGKDA